MFPLTTPPNHESTKRITQLTIRCVGRYDAAGLIAKGDLADPAEFAATGVDVKRCDSGYFEADLTPDNIDNMLANLRSRPRCRRAILLLTIEDDAVYQHWRQHIISAIELDIGVKYCIQKIKWNFPPAYVPVEYPIRHNTMMYSMTYCETIDRWGPDLNPDAMNHLALRELQRKADTMIAILKKNPQILSVCFHVTVPSAGVLAVIEEYITSRLTIRYYGQANL